MTHIGHARSPIMVLVVFVHNRKLFSYPTLIAAITVRVREGTCIPAALDDVLHHLTVARVRSYGLGVGGKQLSTAFAHEGRERLRVSLQGVELQPCLLHPLPEALVCSQADTVPFLCVCGEMRWYCAREGERHTSRHREDSHSYKVVN